MIISCFDITYPLHLYLQPIIRKHETFGQTCVGGIVEADVVGGVDEVGATGAYAAGEGYALIYKQMGGMPWFET